MTKLLNMMINFHVICNDLEFVLIPKFNEEKTGILLNLRVNKSSNGFLSENHASL